MRSRRNYSLGRQFVSESVAKTFSDEKPQERMKYELRRRKWGVEEKDEVRIKRPGEAT
jgi:hypothetical protein